MAPNKKGAKKSVAKSGAKSPNAKKKGERGKSAALTTTAESTADAQNVVAIGIASGNASHTAEMQRKWDELNRVLEFISYRRLPALPIQRTTAGKVSSYIAPWDTDDARNAFEGQGKYDCGFNALNLKNLLTSQRGVPLRMPSIRSWIDYNLLGEEPAKGMTIEQQF